MKRRLNLEQKTKPKEFASLKPGWREIGGTRKYYRSGWEANYACYLEWLKQNGQIQAWMHEPYTFWFSGIKRGVVSYLPDFWVLENSGKEKYHEIKGYMDTRSATKLKRMSRYYPGVEIVVVNRMAYLAIAKKVAGLVPGWI